MQPWLSVLVPVYNVAPYLESMIDSVLCQADPGVEFHLLDDASTDGSLAIAQDLSRREPDRVHVHAFDRNRGVSEVRNALLGHARGDWVWFLDGDDLLEPAVLPRLRQQLSGADAPDMLLLDFRIQRPRPMLKHRLRGEHHKAAYAGPAQPRIDGGLRVLEGVLASGHVFCWTVVARRGLWQAGPRFPPGRVFEDMATMPLLLLQAGSARHLAEPFVRYRRRDDSLSARLGPAQVADLSAALVGLRQAMLQRWPDPPRSARMAVAHQCARNFVAAVRHGSRLPAAEAGPLLARCRADFRAAVGDDLPLLWRHYLRQGWWARAWSLRRALARC